MLKLKIGSFKSFRTGSFYKNSEIPKKNKTHLLTLGEAFAWYVKTCRTE